MELVNYWLVLIFAIAPEDLVAYSANKVMTICSCWFDILSLLDVTFRFEKDHYSVSEEEGRVELCILQNGESIIDLSITAAPQDFTAEGLLSCSYNML